MEQVVASTESNYDSTIILKLSSGQEIVGRLLHEDELQLLLKMPMIIHMQRTESNQFGMTLVPYSFAGNVEQVSFSKFHIIAMMPPDPQFAAQYSANLSGITLADSNSLPKLTL